MVTIPGLRQKLARRSAAPADRTIAADALGLGVAETQVFQQLSIGEIEDQKPFIGSVDVGTHLAAANRAEIRSRASAWSFRNGVVAPVPDAVSLPERVADQDFLAPILVDVDGERIMPGLPAPFVDGFNSLLKIQLPYDPSTGFLARPVPPRSTNSSESPTFNS